MENYYRESLIKDKNQVTLGVKLFNNLCLDSTL
jgi:hypothetical protein